jgi:hypothetical protein
LPQITEEWINLTLQTLQVNRPISFVEDHEQVYLLLRQKVHEHFANGNTEPMLSLLSKPLGSYNWNPDAEEFDSFSDPLVDLLLSDEFEEQIHLSVDDILTVDYDPDDIM